MEAVRADVEVAAEESLDPADWFAVTEAAHRVVDEAIAYLRDVCTQPAWRDVPAVVRERFAEPLPRGPQPLAEVLRLVSQDAMPYPMGNVHPRFWAWYMGSSNLTGALADFLAAIQGSNLGGGNHAAVLIERQVIDWCREMVGFPAGASGTLTSGGSMANLLGLTVARNVKAGIDIREQGVAAMPKPLRFYGSDQIHSCHRR